MAANVTVVLLTGSWHQPLHYDTLVEGLRERGIKVVCHSHPTNTSPQRTLADDIEQARYLVSREVEKGRYVDVITHSFGGVVATGAFEGLGVASRKKEGKQGGVRNMLGMTTFLLPGGTSLVGTFAPRSHPPWIIQNADGSSFPDDPATIFYHDLKEEDRQRAVRLLLPQPLKAQETVVEKATWNEFENVCYLKCTEDKALPPFVQDFIIDKCEKATGIKVKVTETPLSHSPMFFTETVDWAANIIGA